MEPLYSILVKSSHLQCRQHFPNSLFASVFTASMDARFSLFSPLANYVQRRKVLISDCGENQRITINQPSPMTRSCDERDVRWKSRRRLSKFGWLFTYLDVKNHLHLLLWEDEFFYPFRGQKGNYINGATVENRDSERQPLCMLLTCVTWYCKRPKGKVNLNREQLYVWGHISDLQA